MNCLKKIKPIYWFIIIIVILAIIYFSRKNENFSLSVNDDGRYLFFNCPDRFHLFRSDWNKMPIGRPYEEVTGSSLNRHKKKLENIKEYVSDLISCDPINGDIFGEYFKDGIMDLKNLLNQFKDSTNVEEFVNNIHQNHTMYASVFSKLLNSYRSLITNQNTLKCVNSKTEMISDVLNKLKQMSKWEFDNMNAQSAIFMKLNDLLTTYNDDIGTAKNDMLYYIKSTIEVSDLPSFTKETILNSINQKQKLIENLARIVLNKQQKLSLSSSSQMSTSLIPPMPTSPMPPMPTSTM